MLLLYIDILSPNLSSLNTFGLAWMIPFGFSAAVRYFKYGQLLSYSNINSFTFYWIIETEYSMYALFHSVRVSNELGSGNPQAASLAVRVVLSMALIEGVILVSAMILLRNVWGHVYSNDKEVIRYVSFMMPVLALSSFLDGIQGTLSGIPR